MFPHLAVYLVIGNVATEIYAVGHIQVIYQCFDSGSQFSGAEYVEFEIYSLAFELMSKDDGHFRMFPFQEPGHIH